MCEGRRVCVRVGVCEGRCVGSERVECLLGLECV